VTPAPTTDDADTTDAVGTGGDTGAHAGARPDTGCPRDAMAAPRRGRPRDARADGAILAAAGDVLAEQGLAGFTVDAVAARAGVAKATIYRRWPSRADLLLETAHMAVVEMPQPDTGSLREDLVLLMGGLARKMRTTSAGQLLPAVLAEAAVNPHMDEIFCQHVCERRTFVRQAVERGIARGELPPEADVDLMMDLLAGPIFVRVMMTHGPIDDAVVERIVDTVLYGAVARPASG
jgi:AcrR family transcriptional regulator